MRSEEFQKKIIDYHLKEGRDFPWRSTDSDLHALVAEIMLQQTSYYQVEPQYKNFCKRFETSEEVLDAKDEELRESFDGLGLENRFRYVKNVAEFLCSEKSISQENLSEIKGIGRYTANAFLSIHKNRNLPIVDGNVKRVFDKFFDTKDYTDKDYWNLAEELLPEENVREYNLGLIDYGTKLYGKNPE